MGILSSKILHPTQPALFAFSAKGFLFSTTSSMLEAKKSKLTIFDEPEAGIDLWSFNSLIQVFKKMRAEIRGTIITISHQERILDIADKIVLLVDGKIEKIGSKEDVFEDKKFVSSTCKFLEKGGKING